MSVTYTSLDDEDFNRHFREFRRSAFRLETLQAYDVSYEEDAYERFLAGEARGAFPGISEWIEDTVRPAVITGRHLHRVHVIELPPSDYVRFECAWAYEHTSRAGEDIRIIPVATGQWPEGVPRHDYWLFDDALLMDMHYAADAEFLAAEVVEDSRRVDAARMWRDTAVARSEAYAGFARRTGITRPATSPGHRRPGHTGSVRLDG